MTLRRTWEGPLAVGQYRLIFRTISPFGPTSTMLVRNGVNRPNMTWRTSLTKSASRARRFNGRRSAPRADPGVPLANISQEGTGVLEA